MVSRAPVLALSLTRRFEAAPLSVVKFPPTNRLVPSVARALTGPPPKLALNVLNTLPSARQNATRLACAAGVPVGDTALLNAPPT